MAPVLFNLYTCLVMERWMARVEGTEGAGINIKYKYDGKLFRRYTRNTCSYERRITECLFADDGALLSSTRQGAERTALEYQKTGGRFGLVVNIAKTKHMVTGRIVEGSDRGPMALEGGKIDEVDEFQYLGSVMANSGTMDADVQRRVAQVPLVH